VGTNLNPNALLKTLLLMALLILYLEACGDDDPAKPKTHPTPSWQEVDLGQTANESRIVAVDFTGSYGMAVRMIAPDSGATVYANEYFRLQSGGDWLMVDPGNIRPGFVSLDVALDTNGKAVLAGTQQPGLNAVVLDLRGPVAEYIEQSTAPMLTVDGEGSFMVAGGRSRGGGLWTSVGPGNWNFDDLPLTGTNDSGFHDVYVRGDRAVACGYDDGADTLRVILTRTTSTNWEKISTPGEHFARTYHCIALDEGGTIFVGGIQGAGGLSPKAFLSQRSIGGHWTDLTLPDPDLVHGVRDICIAGDNSMYLACYGEGDDTMANLIHVTPGGARKDITPFPGGLLQVGQAASGNIYAVGFRREESTGAEQGVMLVKTP
jgi:hypothetical protein